MLKLKHLIVLLLCALFTCGSLAYGAEQDDTSVPGYDENTEVTIKGAVAESPAYGRGPILVRIQSGSKMHQVITGPKWYLRQEGISFAQGDRLQVTGSKYVDRDGNVYLVAKRIKNTDTGKEFIFRDMACKPLWMGHGRGMGRMGR